MARRTSETQTGNGDARRDDARLQVSDADGVLSFGDGEFADDTVIAVTDEVLALLSGIALPGTDAGLEASLGWNFFVFG